MFTTRLVRQFKVSKAVRQFNSTAAVRENKSNVSNIEQQKMDAQKDFDAKNSVLGSRMHNVSELDKRLLVWVKRYPAVADVPAKVTHECILQARSKARIRLCNIMIVITLMGYLYAALSGKKLAEENRNLNKIIGTK